jgi:hypothetical protein
MKLKSCITVLLISVFLVFIPTTLQSQVPSSTTVPRSYTIATLGRVEMSIPARWQENVRLLEVPPAFTLAYRLPASKDFYMKVTGAWEPQQERASRDPSWLRRAVEKAGGALDKKNLKLIEVSGPSAKGYYFQVAHKEKFPIGEFKFLVQGIIDLGTITLVFSAYSKEKDIPELSEALRVVQSAHFIAAN